MFKKQQQKAFSNQPIFLISLGTSIPSLMPWYAFVWNYLLYSALAPKVVSLKV